MSWSRSLVLWSGALAAACGDGGIGGRPTHGGLGQVTVRPECGALSQACIGQGLDAPLVRGGTLELLVELSLPGSAGVPVVLESANPAVIEADDTTLHARGDGLSAILFLGPDGRVLDLLHVWVHAAEQLRIQRYAPDGRLLGQVQPSGQLLVGDELLVAVEPFANGQALLGNFELAIATDGDAVAVLPDPVAGWYRVVARRPGSAVVSFGALGHDAGWHLEVLP